MSISFNYPEKIFDEYVLQSEKIHGLQSVQILEICGESVALQQALYLGSQQKRLNIDHLIQWNNLILQDYRTLGEKIDQVSLVTIQNTTRNELELLLNEIQSRIDQVISSSSSIEKVKLQADIFCKFEKLNLFPSGNGALVRIVINYVNSRLFSPICLFRAAENNELDEAKKDLKKAQRFFAKKIKEAAFDRFFTYMKCTGSSGNSYFYSGFDGEEMTIQWHELASWSKNI